MRRRVQSFTKDDSEEAARNCRNEYSTAGLLQRERHDQGEAEAQRGLDEVLCNDRQNNGPAKCNSLRRDDGVGPFVATLLEQSPEVSAIACTQLTPELAEPISQADRVIFVDADARLAPGRIVVQTLQTHSSARIHEFDPETLLDWSRKLYGRAPEAKLIAIGVESFDVGDGLSPAVQRAAHDALKAIQIIFADSNTGAPRPRNN